MTGTNQKHVYPLFIVPGERMEPSARKHLVDLLLIFKRAVDEFDPLILEQTIRKRVTVLGSINSN